MKVGIAGFAGSGKSTVFQWLTGAAPDPAASQRGQLGIAKVPDDRLAWLSAQFKPKKTTPATIEFLDTPGLITTEQRDNPRRLAILRDAGGLLVVLNGFHERGLADQLTRFRYELIFADLEIVSNRIGKLEDQIKKPRPAKQKEVDQQELDLLRRVEGALKAEKSAASLGLKDDEEKAIRSFQLLTLSPAALAVPAKLEMELEELSEKDRQDFMKDLGVTGLSRDQTLRSIYAGMGQNVFFTVGEDECRAWGIPRGADAVTGAAQIHTDLARGFVRGEVVSYDDFRRLGSMKEAKSHGVYRLEGKTYIVKDGDIMHILAST